MMISVDIWSNHNNLSRLLLNLKWHQTIDKNSEVAVLEDNTVLQNPNN